MTLPALTVLNRYELTGGAAAFRAATSALAARVEAQGEPGIVGYRFYANAEGTEGRAVVDYATPAAWIGHHERSMAWPEMAALHKVARLADVRFLGAVTDEIRAWIARSGLSVSLDEGWDLAAGFRR